MERVQFQQEQMVAELKDLVEKGLFTQSEIKQIMKKRTAFETALVRRIAKKNDYFRYISYEMGLEALRKKRVERLKLARSTPSISDYALVRRQFHIFERALKKFKADIGLWIQYIEVAKKEGARSLVGRICARALQLHPTVPALYILAASHELAHLSPSAARALLQRGIRLNADSVEMWTEYVKMELGFVESMRRRWGVLGINMNGKGKAKAQQEPDADGAMNEGQVEQMQNSADSEGNEAEQARKEIMQGAIVKSVIANAVKALPNGQLFVSLHGLLSRYPTTVELRTSLLDHLHSLLQQTLPTDPIAARLSATRHLLPELSSTALIDALKAANQQLSTAVSGAYITSQGRDADAISKAYTDFIEEWVQKDEVDIALKAYLVTSLHALITRLNDKAYDSQAPAPLLASHLSLLARHPSIRALLPYAKNAGKFSKRYTSSPPGQSNARVWLARLELSKALEVDDVELSKLFREARSLVQGNDILDVWVWGLSPSTDGLSEESTRVELQRLEELIGESMRMQDAPSFRTVHDGLLLRYVNITKYISSPQTRLSYFRKTSTAYLPDATTFAAFFNAEASLPSETQSEDVLKEIYYAWKRRAVVDATLAWAAWLLDRGKGKEATDIVQRARAEAGPQRQALDDGWRKVLQNSQSAEDDAAEESDVEMEIS